MSYSETVARIAQLDPTTRRGGEWAWMAPAASTASNSFAATSATALTATSPFAGVLQGLVGSTTLSTSAVGAISAYGSGSDSDSIPFTSPLPHGKLSQAFGPTTETLEPSAKVGGVTYAHYHNGIDLAAPKGSAVRAAAAGTVIFAGKQSDGAVIVKIRHADGYVTLYGHLDPSLDVKVGDQVAGGEKIGEVGMTGVTTGPHLHFGLYTPGGTAIDPSTSLASGSLPGQAVPAVLLGPNPEDPNNMIHTSGPAAVARFDAVASKIPYAAEIRSAALKAGIDPLLLASLVKAESSFHASSKSGCGAMGLCQLMPRTATSMGVADPWNAQQNLNGGAKYLAKQLKGFGRVDMALAAYNAGPGAVGHLGAVPDSKKGYVAKILRTWANYEGFTS
jgi:murein DD-endopeptidase MepM/ murein hydrolase activator NlpD